MVCEYLTPMPIKRETIVGFPRRAYCSVTGANARLLQHKLLMRVRPGLLRWCATGKGKVRRKMVFGCFECEMGSCLKLCGSEVEVQFCLKLLGLEECGLGGISEVVIGGYPLLCDLRGEEERAVLRGLGGVRLGCA